MNWTTDTWIFRTAAKLGIRKMSTRDATKDWFRLSERRIHKLIKALSQIWPRICKAHGLYITHVFTKLGHRVVIGNQLIPD